MSNDDGFVYMRLGDIIVTVTELAPDVSEPLGDRVHCATCLSHPHAYPDCNGPPNQLGSGMIFSLQLSFYFGHSCARSVVICPFAISAVLGI